MDAEHVKIPVGISSCLLGERVRYDGGHKSTPTSCTLGAYFEFKAFCPELSIGLGVPRKTIRLIRSDSEVRCVESNDISKDYTDRMKGCADEQLPWQRRLCGYILKKIRQAAAWNASKSGMKKCQRGTVSESMLPD